MDARNAITASEKTKLRAVPIGAVKLGDGFWKKKMDANHERALPRLLGDLREHGVIDNFMIVSGRKQVERRGPYFTDSDLYKWMEGAAWDLQTYSDPKRSSELDAIIEEVIAAQGKDGYLNTYFQGALADQRFKMLESHHELYCAGHLFQAAIAHYRSTGSDKLLSAACRFADYLVDNFGPGKIEKADGHPEIEMALVELYRTTGEKKYLDLAGFLLTMLKFPEMTQVAGHAVRAMYTCCGGADYFAETADPTYQKAGEALWQDLTSGKYYVTGGVGSRYAGEAIGFAYELPNLHAYAETCAAIANMMWQYRMLGIYGEAKFADEMERALYNGIISGVSLAGDEYFYVNPLTSTGNHGRKAWYGCTCCPTNVVRTMASIPGYMYSISDDGAWVHLFDRSRLDYKLVDGTPFSLEQSTDYPWDGRIEIKIGLGKPVSFKLHVRVPGWCPKASIAVNDEDAGTVEPGSYAVIDRGWHDGDTVRLVLEMPITLVECDPRVRENYRAACVTRGPLVYCVESTDNPDVSVLELCLSPGEFEESRATGLEGVIALRGKGLTPEQTAIGGSLYRAACNARFKETSVTMIPYYAWCNREQSQMTVWMPYA